MLLILDSSSDPKLDYATKKSVRKVVTATGASGLKTDVESGMFWSEIGSGIGESCGTLLPRILRSTPTPGQGPQIFPKASLYLRFCFSLVAIIELEASALICKLAL